MIILDSTVKSLEVDLDGAVTTNQLPIVASYVDVTTTTYSPGSFDTQTNGTTAVTAVAAPAASTQRQVKLLTVFNRDTVAAVVTVQLNNNGTLRTLVKVTLQVGDTLVYTDGEGWRVLTSGGQVKFGFGAHDHSLSTESNALLPLSLDVTGGPLKLSGDITPAQITSNQNNYDPTGLATASTLRLSSDAAHDVTGLAGGSDGRVILLLNVGSFPITLKHGSGSSDANKRFWVAGLTDLVLESNEAVLLQYYGGNDTWRPIGSTSGMGSWQAWTPVVEQPVATNVTLTVNVARYRKIGKLVEFYVSVSVTGTGTANSEIVMTLPPVTPNSSMSSFPMDIGVGHLLDSSASLIYPFFPQIVSGTTVSFRSTASGVGTAFLGNNQFTAALASGDVFRLFGSYEAA